ncbi:3'-5' exonuclease [Acetobacter senegalensis]|uniref:3'-5' exonuclease n=1 Tax=Acetobacter senegalensis TaxID=446692 RepID=UPI001EDC0E4F|nr:3'-5' exonuclease [Acetobacter senegalensis]MCG4258167.1 3'-5' exonuclease [Acetobacter senegalensis]MCG4268094.1 3'-5' exonuclease [Acetobacter senegalensis]
MILFYDTETTGLPDRYAPLNSEKQPRCVQIAAILTDESGAEQSCVNLVIHPDGWTIPDAAARVHGITTEKAKLIGVREAVAAAAFYDLTCKADLVVAHNEKFDRQIVRIMFERLGRGWAFEKPAYDTMEAAAPIVNLPPTPRMVAAGIDKPKAPKLEECIQHFFGEKLDGAHDALVDVRACARLFFHLNPEGTPA